MMEIELDPAMAKIGETYPKWKPTAMQIKAVRAKLRRYPARLVEPALLESYVPGKRVLPEKNFFEALVKLARQTVTQAAPAAVVDVITDQQYRDLMADAAAGGNAMAMDYCDRHGIEISIPF